MTDKNDQTILVIKRKRLFRYKANYFQGDIPSAQVNFEQIILDGYEWMRRGDAEQNPHFKQPIGYCLVTNPGLRKVFAFQRSKEKGKYDETRLQGNYSWGSGGHIERKDTSDKQQNPIQESMQRELDEELEFVNGGVQTPQPIGYINDDSNSVGQVHFGILYLAKTDATIIKPKDPEIANGNLKTIAELEEILASPDCEVENWSRIAMEPLRRILIK